MRVDPAIWLTKSLTPAVICPVRFSAPSDSAMFFGGRFDSPAAGMLPRLALLKIETVTWLSRKNRWMYFARWNSLPVFGVWPSNGFHGVQALPSSSSSPVGLFDELGNAWTRSEEHTSELQSRLHLVCRLLLEKKRITKEGSDSQSCTMLYD